MRGDSFQIKNANLWSFKHNKSSYAKFLVPQLCNCCYAPNVRIWNGNGLHEASWPIRRLQVHLKYSVDKEMKMCSLITKSMNKEKNELWIIRNENHVSMTNMEEQIWYSNWNQ